MYHGIFSLLDNVDKVFDQSREETFNLY